MKYLLGFQARNKYGWEAVTGQADGMAVTSIWRGECKDTLDHHRQHDSLRRYPQETPGRILSDYVALDE